VIAAPVPPPAVLDRYALDAQTVRPLTGGHINRSFAVRGRNGGDYVLQRVNPIFPPEIHDDIDAVTRHLLAKGMTTPVLVASVDGQRFVEIDSEIWRLLTRIPGETCATLTTAAEACEAGRVLGQFHRAVADFDRPLRNRRPPVHELARHLGNLDRALGEKIHHPAHRAITAIAGRILAMARDIEPLIGLPLRLVHGDPKISNVIFRDSPAATPDASNQKSRDQKSRKSNDRHRIGICLVDLDTLTRMPVAFELGDALRSWCNTAAEDSPAAQFSIERCAAALAGYRQGAGDLLTPAEWHAVPAATLMIATELAARFAADALNESYFGWDPERFPSASAHQQARAEAQLRLAASIAAALPLLHRQVMTEA
jgi:Ser/Thr protein kinase RdoA (MazF antagonist)